MGIKKAIIVDEESLIELENLIISLDVESGSLLNKLYGDVDVRKNIIKICDDVFKIAKILKVFE